MAPKKATTARSAATDATSRGVTTRLQDQRRAETAGAAPPNREETPLPPPGRGGGLGGTEAGNRNRNGAAEGGAGLNAPPRASTPRPRAGSPSAPPPRRDGEASAARDTPSTSRHSIPGLPGVHNRNDALAMVRSMLDFPLTPDSPQFAAWLARVDALLEFSRLRSDAPRARSQSGLSPA